MCWRGINKIEEKIKSFTLMARISFPIWYVVVGMFIA